ncbi:MAG: hypothetical protein A2622_05170 [Bdellovibrionales bacterium RIFCSPHIGHO2_01_FULL_40_29]|nr:MAG: hypothetical protein A2622_05170 [Bdellovibrionales bacterium RIFCSPHIGHO2_01_FULL_40_29]OFZ34681.1 MAG: hypothetical protein A3D17_10200 [Bdellovibrionales bacterium RIFCSPHIGHO2_02_FULL_40_15]
MNTPNESPFSNPKFLIAIVLTFLGLWGWQYYMNKTYPPQVLAPKPVTTTPIATDNKAASEPAVTTSGAAKDVEIVVPAEEKTVSYEDALVRWTLSSNGMGFKTFELKNYKDRKQGQIEFVSSENLFSVYANNQKVNFNLTSISDVEFRGEAQVDGKRISRTLKYNKNNSSFESNLEFDGALNTITFSIDEKKLTPSGGSFFMPSFEKQDFLYQQAGKIVSEPISSLDAQEVFNKRSTAVTLASIGTQYFTIASIDKSELAPVLNMTVQGGQAKMQMIYETVNSQVKSLRQIYFVGAKDPDVLKRIDSLMPEVMDYGIFGFIAKPLLMLMKFMHSIFGNWGLAIIGLTLVVRIVLLPFNVMSFRSARAMQKIQPLLKDIRDRYKSDPLKVNRETMALMKEHKANPLSGCLPMLIQIPIFFALWKTIGSSVEIYQQPFFGWIQDLSSHDPFFVIPVLMGVTMFFQQKLTPTTMDPMQQKILNFMPIIFTVFMFSLPSGLTLYNFVSALFGVIQQYFLLKDTSAKAA